MIATKFCDVCDTELPPLAFLHSYQCADVDLHKNHPDETHSSVRVAAMPSYTSGGGDRRPDLCPDCFLKLLKRVVTRFEAIQRRERPHLKRWKEWRTTSRKAETERAGCNEKRAKVRAVVALLLAAMLVFPMEAAQQRRPAERVKTVGVRFKVPEWARYRTTDADGTVTVWRDKPFLVTTDGPEAYTFWITDGCCFNYSIEGGVAPKGTRWERSLRRVR